MSQKTELDEGLGPSPENKDLQHLLEQIEEHSEARGKAVLDKIDHTEAIVKLAREVKRTHGLSAAELTVYVKRMDEKQRRLIPISRQAMRDMLLQEEPEPPKPARRRKSRLNTEALA